VAHNDQRAQTMDDELLRSRITRSLFSQRGIAERPSLGYRAFATDLLDARLREL
jgi:hypothetical protein